MGVKRAALIGCGDVSVIHFEAIDAIEDIELVAVCDVDPDRLEAVATARGVASYDDHLQMIAEAGPDVVHITTPHHQHVQLSIDCLGAGVHVIQEKPLAHTLSDGQLLVDAAAGAVPKIGICLQNRYNVSSQEARRLLDSGQLGEIRGAYASVVWTRTPAYYVDRPWRGTWAQSGGGLLINQAIHTLDLVQWLMGDVVTVQGQVATNKFGDVIEVEDTAEALFTHANGAQTSFYATLTAPVHRPVEIEIHCENAQLAIRNGLEVTWADGRVDVYPERAVPSGGRSYWGVSHEVLIRDFYAGLAEPEPFWIGPAQAMASLEMLTALYANHPLANHPRQGTDMTDKKVRLGIIGLGAEGGMYAQFINQGMVPNVAIGAICDIDASKRAKAEEYGVPFYEDYIAMIESGEVDAVVTTVPHYLHPEMGIAALERGVHALVEKPVGVYTKQARALIDFAATKPELTFGVFFNQRTNPLYIDLRDLIASGELGALRHTSWIITNWWRPQQYYNQSEWRATWGGEGGGVLVNQAPHQLDLWQWMCGVPVKCFAKLAFGFRRDLVVEDEVNALVDFGNGATGHFMTCTSDIVGTDRLEMLFDNGKIVVDNSSRVTITRLAAPEQELSANMGMEEVMLLFTGKLDTDELYSVQVKDYESVWGHQHCTVMQNFAANILDGTPLIAPGPDGINGVRLANAMHLSAWTGREVDMVDFDEETYLAELNARITAEGKFPTRS